MEDRKKRKKREREEKREERKKGGNKYEQVVHGYHILVSKPRLSNLRLLS